jgi:hypothetical protein
MRADVDMTAIEQEQGPGAAETEAAEEVGAEDEAAEEVVAEAEAAEEVGAENEAAAGSESTGSVFLFVITCKIDQNQWNADEDPT